jgi:TRAP-type mannitol/chloroaromatic compound transport system permease small subunit
MEEQRQAAMSPLRTALSVIDNTNEWIGKIISFLMFPIVLIMVYGVIMRYFFNAPSLWADDSSLLICGVYLLLGGGYAMLRRMHVNMDVVYNLFPFRTKAIIDVFTSLLFFLFCYVLVRYGAVNFWNSFSMRELTAPPVVLPVYPAKFAVPLGAFLLAMQGLAKFVRNLVIVITGESHAC